MNKKTQTFLSLVLSGLIAAACSRGDNRTRQFEVVEEGSADGVTSVIAAPGEQVPPLTDTSADTTTAFATLPTPPNVDPTLTTTNGSLAETLPDMTTGTGYGRYPNTDSRPRPQPQPRGGTIEITRPPQTTPTPPTETTPPVTTTVPPTETAQQPPPPEAKKDPPKDQEDDAEEEEEDDPPSQPPAPPLR